MVRLRQQVLHFGVCVDHVALSAIDVVAKLRDLCILSLDLCVEVLSLVLSRFHDANHFVELAILVLEHVFLLLKYLSIVQVTSLVKLTVLATFVSGLVLGSG